MRQLRERPRGARLSYEAIAAQVNEQGYTTRYGKTWTRAGVFQVLSRVVVCQKRRRLERQRVGDGMDLRGTSGQGHGPTMTALVFESPVLTRQTHGEGRIAGLLYEDLLFRDSTIHPDGTRKR